MPLIKSGSRQAIGQNIATESKTKPRKQAIAIALNVARKAGGNVPPPPAASRPKRKPKRSLADMMEE